MRNGQDSTPHRRDARVQNRTVQGDRVYESHLIRRSYREDGKVKHQNVANITHLPPAVIDMIRRALQGETVVPLTEAFNVVESRHHGHVQAILTAMRRLGIAACSARNRSTNCAAWTVFTG